MKAVTRKEFLEHLSRFPSATEGSPLFGEFYGGYAVVTYDVRRGRGTQRIAQIDVAEKERGNGVLRGHVRYFIAE